MTELNFSDQSEFSGQSDKEIGYIKLVLLAIGVLIILITVTSFYFWKIYLEEQHFRLQTEAGQNLIDELKIVRSWVASQGGVYVPITEDVQPNSYLQDSNKNIVTENGKRLTKINAAYLTRMLSELMKKNMEIKFDLTSLNSINPENKPNSWQKNNLEQFRAKKEPQTTIINSNDQVYFKYMEPLTTSESCLKCHAKQGYEVGEIRGGVSVSFPLEQEILDQNMSKIMWWHFFILFGTLTTIFLLGSRLVASMKAHKQYKKKLKEAATYDDLTGLLNRRSLMENIRQEFNRAKQYGLSFSVIMLDLDHFKKVNDKYGHACGDVVLREVAKKMEIESRKNDVVARFGGEEFLLVLSETKQKEALEVAERIRKKIAETTINCDQSTISVTASLGVVELTKEIEDVDKLIMLADEYMYEAKETGRNKVCKR